jgi:hypothetical protein
MRCNARVAFCLFCLTAKIGTLGERPLLAQSCRLAQHRCRLSAATGTHTLRFAVAGIREIRESSRPATTTSPFTPSRLPTVLSDVRYWMNSRRHLLAKSISGFDPGCVKTRLGEGCAELFSQLPSPERSCQYNRLPYRRNRDGSSTRKSDIGVFTQPRPKPEVT